MPLPSRYRTATASLAALVLAGCAGTGASTTADAPAEQAPPAPPSAAAPSAPATADLEALYWARQKSARADFTEADVRFMTGMIGHHAQALIMSRLAPDRAASPAVRTLAARILNAQADEIASMQRWLEDRGQPIPEVHIDGLLLMIHGLDDHAGHGGHGGHDHASMPGMLSQAQLEELDAARGPDFDRLFLRYMIQHHGGAVTMVDDLFAADGAAQDRSAYRLASDIHADQVTEIARMETMLDALADQP